jgi:hypothetical protein
MFREIFTSHKAVLKIAVIVESNWQRERLMGRMIRKRGYCTRNNGILRN